MRIVSKTSDYYDNAMRYGQDKSVVFVRDCREFEGFHDPLVKPLHAIAPNGRNVVGTREVQFEVKRFIIGFCGFLYRGIKIERSTRNMFGWIKAETRCLYSSEEYINWLGAYGIDPKKNDMKPWYTINKVTHEEWLNLNNNVGSAFKWMLDNRVSVFTIQYTPHFNPDHTFLTTLNGRLNEFQFYRVFDSYQAYQELDMYISGTLPKQDAMTSVVSDKDRIAQRGFDKWSFRKMPTKNLHDIHNNDPS